jgi:hypothetical protein
MGAARLCRILRAARDDRWNGRGSVRLSFLSSRPCSSYGDIRWLIKYHFDPYLITRFQPGINVCYAVWMSASATADVIITATCALAILSRRSEPDADLQSQRQSCQSCAERSQASIVIPTPSSDRCAALQSSRAPSRYSWPCLEVSRHSTARHFAR